MASTYNYLGIEKMATGENAGTWGTKTNTNLDIIQQACSGYHSQSIAGGAQTTAMLITDGDATSVTDALTNAARNQVIELTGTITGNQIVTFPTSTEGLHAIFNNTSGGYTVQLKGASDSGSGTTFSTTDKGTKFAYMSGTDLVEIVTGTVTASSTTTFTNKTFTAPKYADGGFVADANGNENLVWGATSSAVNEFKIANAATGNGPTLSSVSTSGTDSNIDINITPAGTGDVVLAGDTVKVGDSGAAATLTSNGAGVLTVTTGGATDLVLNTNSGTNSGTIQITDGANGDIAVTPNGSGAVLLDGLSWPTADGTADYVLKTDGSASLSWVEMSGGTSWQAVQTTGFTAAAGKGYFCNTSSAAFTVTLPAGTLGDEVSIIDYGATFDTNNLTVSPDGSEKIQGAAADLTVATERAGFTLVYTDGTQGWLLKDK